MNRYQNKLHGLVRYIKEHGFTLKCLDFEGDVFRVSGWGILNEQKMELLNLGKIVDEGKEDERGLFCQQKDYIDIKLNMNE